jgi:hypothetical protein
MPSDSTDNIVVGPTIVSTNNFDDVGLFKDELLGDLNGSF